MVYRAELCSCGWGKNCSMVKGIKNSPASEGGGWPYCRREQKESCERAAGSAGRCSGAELLRDKAQLAGQGIPLYGDGQVYCRVYSSAPSDPIITVPLHTYVDCIVIFF